MIHLPDDEALIFEARSLVYEMSGISVEAQKAYPISKWYQMYEVSMKRLKQKTELALLSRH